jgi:hypothetical protein
MTIHNFLGASCLCSLCCFLLGVTIILIGVAMMSSLLQAPFPTSIFLFLEIIGLSASFIDVIVDVLC